MRLLLIETIALLFYCGFASAGLVTLNDRPNRFETTKVTSTETEIIINFAYLDTTAKADGYTLTLPDYFRIGSGWKTGPFQTVLPCYTILLAVPKNTTLSVSIDADESIDIDNFNLATVDEDNKELIENIAPDGGFYPQKLVEFESAGQMRDLHLARLTIQPVQYDYDQQVLKVHYSLAITAHHPGGDICSSDNHISEAFYPVYNAILTNSSLFDDINLRRGGYWFIVHDDFATSITPLVEWKKAKGFDVRVYLLSDIGYNPSYTVIYNFISQEYNSAETKPDYICLVGDVSMPSGHPGLATRTYSNPFGFGTIDSDNYYTFLEGNDYFPELFIGRISVDYESELQAYINKHFGYERNPYMDETNWYHQATVIGLKMYSYWVDDTIYTPRMTKLWCREMMMNYGYTDVDTFFATDYHSPPAYQITNSISRGVTFVNYRGYGDPDGWTAPWYTSSNLYQINNGPKYGVMHSIVCGTGDYSDYSDVCFGETWIRLSNKGGPGFIGTTNHDSHTRYNNAIDCGIYWGLFEKGTYTLAQSQLMGKMSLFYAFPNETYPNGRIESYFNSYNVLGDPELNCWIDIPKAMIVSHSDTLNVGQTGVNITVTDINGNPLQNAYACLWKSDDLFVGKFTDDNGHANFQIEPTTTGQIAVTVTAPNFIPYEGVIEIISAEMAVGLVGYLVDDDNEGSSSGDGDMITNPAETIELTPILKNYGSSQTAINVQATISSNDQYIDILSSTSSYGSISPDDSAFADQPYVIEIAPQAPDGYSIELVLNITEDSGNSWQNFIFLPVSAASLNANHVIIQADDNGNNIIEPGESVELVLDLTNSGSKRINSANSILRTFDTHVQIIDSIGYFGDIDTDETNSNTDDPFALSVSDDIYIGHEICFTLEITGSSGQMQETEFIVLVGTISSTDPIGPDNYGYYCFDNTDTTYLYHPEYEWIEIEASWDTVTLYDDKIETIDLPFRVQYYGQGYNQVSICDNGYIAFGNTSWINHYNANIPSPQCASAMAAVFWDDLISGSSYNPMYVRYHYDEDNGKFIIGWDNVKSNDTYRWATFEIVILDENLWPTTTGDNELIFQYQDINYPNSNSIGICNQSMDIGLEYQFNTRYAHGAATLASGRAIKFTTGSEYMVGYNEHDTDLPEKFYLMQNYPNPFNANTKIQYSLPSDCMVHLDIYDILGRKVTSLVDGFQQSGNWSVIWNGKDNKGLTVSAGIYFYRLLIGKNKITKRMLLLK